MIEIFLEFIWCFLMVDGKGINLSVMKLSKKRKFKNWVKNINIYFFFLGKGRWRLILEVRFLVE